MNEELENMEWFQKPPQQNPPQELDDQFYALLESAKTETRRAKVTLLWPRWTQVGMAAAACVGAFWLGRVSMNDQLEAVNNQLVLAERNGKQISEKPTTSKLDSKPSYNETALMTKPVVQKATLSKIRSEGAWQETVLKRPIIAEIADLRQQMQETKQLLMFSLLKKDSPSERIKAVNYALDFDRADAQVIDVLVKTLNEDANTNVRLAAIEALSRFSQSQIVREALVKTLNRQSDPILQLMVIESLVSMREKRALPQMQTLLENAQTDVVVKEKIQESISLLTI